VSFIYQLTQTAMKTNKPAKIFGVAIFSFIFSFVQAQPIVQVDFEQFDNGTNFTRTSWQTAGCTVPWVNGFDANRGAIDNSYARSGSKALRLFYPKGQFGTANTGGQAPLTLPPLDEYYMSYAVLFADDFSWGGTSEGGKLPGLACGGRCSGCAPCTGSNGFTARLMWRTGGKAVIYLYHLDKVSPPCGDNYEIVLGGQTLVFQKGVWYKIAQRVKVNSGSNHDGEVEMWINDQHAQIRLYNGTLVDKLTGIQFVSNGDKVDQFYFSTFHGGGDANWAPKVDSYAWFDDIVVSAKQSDVLGVVTSAYESTNNNSGSLTKTMLLKPNEEFTLPFVTTNLEAEWMDMQGQIVAKTTVFANRKTKTPSLVPGVYVLRYEQQNAVYKQKVQVER
jgi:hypothetical protein